MKLKKIIAVVFALAALAVAYTTVSLSFTYKNSLPQLLSPPEEARQQVTGLMDAVCLGDYAQASTFLLGTPELGVDREAADDVSILIWDAFMESLSYEVVGDCSVNEDGLAQEVVLRCMDITSVTATLKERSQTLLQQRVDAAEHTSEVFDENYDYREDVVMDVLYIATQQALKEDAKEMETQLTLQLSYRDGHWWVVADNALLDAISGGILY